MSTRPSKLTPGLPPPPASQNNCCTSTPERVRPVPHACMKTRGDVFLSPSSSYPRCELSLECLHVACKLPVECAKPCSNSIPSSLGAREMRVRVHAYIHLSVDQPAESRRLGVPGSTRLAPALWTRTRSPILPRARSFAQDQEQLARHPDPHTPTRCCQHPCSPHSLPPCRHLPRRQSGSARHVRASRRG